MDFNRVNSSAVGGEAGGSALNARCQLPLELKAGLPPGQMLAGDGMAQTIGAKICMMKCVIEIFYFFIFCPFFHPELGDCLKINKCKTCVRGEERVRLTSR